MTNQRFPISISIAIIIVCVLLFAAREQVPAILALWPLDPPLHSGLPDFQLWQLVSYGFLHGSGNHLFFNMLALYMFGLPLERQWGLQRFVWFYLVCLIGAGLTQLAVQALSGEAYPTIGASGAVFGLLFAFGVTYPNTKLLLLFFPVPIKAKYFVVLYAIAELVFGITGAMPQIAHFAHLGGMLFGLLVFLQWGWRPKFLRR